MKVLRFILHLAVGTLGVVILAAFSAFSATEALHLFFSTIGSRTASWILTETPYFPVQIATGLLLGFQIGRRYGHRVMLWVWVVPALLIALAIRFAPLHPVVVSGAEISSRQHFFG